MYRYKIPPVIFDVLVKLRILGHPTDYDNIPEIIQLSLKHVAHLPLFSITSNKTTANWNNNKSGLKPGKTQEILAMPEEILARR